MARLWLVYYWIRSRKNRSFHLILNKCNNTYQPMISLSSVHLGFFSKTDGGNWLIQSKTLKRENLRRDWKICLKEINNSNNNSNIVRKSRFPYRAWPELTTVWYGPTKLDKKLSQNVQNIRWSHKRYRENHETLKRGIDNRKEKLNWSKDPKRYIPRRCPTSITIYNCDDATQPHTQEMHSWIQTY